MRENLSLKKSTHQNLTGGGRVSGIAMALLALFALETRMWADPLTVKAWMKDVSGAKEYPVRLLGDLNDFRQREVPLSKYGGWAQDKLKATGFFRAEKVTDRWWLVDPEGCRYLHVAVVSVSMGAGPQSQKPFADKYGTPAKWADVTTRWLWDQGYTGTGAWSADKTLVAAPQRLVYTPIWNFMSSYGKKRGGTTSKPGHTGYPNDCIFVFEPEFAAFVEEHAKQLAATKDDPWLLGHFSDNEMPFPKDSLDRFLKLDAADAGRKAVEAWMKARELDPTKIGGGDREAWRGYVVDTYLSIVGKAIRKNDPNHMFLGPRFYGPEKSATSIWRAAGKHLDAIGMNIYENWNPKADVGKWTRWADKPIIVTEWYAKGQDSGMPNTSGAGWTVPTQKDRGRFYQHFTLEMLESKGCVGWHWFKYMDNDPENMKVDASNRDSNKGMITTRYEPYGDLVDLMKPLNRAVYPLTEHFDREKAAP